MIEQEQRSLNQADPQTFSRDAETPRALTPYESLLTWLVLTLLSAPSQDDASCDDGSCAVTPARGIAEYSR